MKQHLLCLAVVAAVHDLLALALDRAFLLATPFAAQRCGPAFELQYRKDTPYHVVEFRTSMRRVHTRRRRRRPATSFLELDIMHGMCAENTPPWKLSAKMLAQSGRSVIGSTVHVSVDSRQSLCKRVIGQDLQSSRTDNVPAALGNVTKVSIVSSTAPKKFSLTQMRRRGSVSRGLALNTYARTLFEISKARLMNSSL